MLLTGHRIIDIIGGTKKLKYDVIGVVNYDADNNYNDYNEWGIGVKT